MPIRPELRKYYGAEWRRYRLVLLDLAKNKCANCGMKHKYLNGAHVHHDPRNGQLITILCPACHARHDTPQRVAMTRRTRARRVGQLWLTPELEYAPYASWMVPRRVLDESQLGLFE
jgi:5-methylcytosine-specific restriction endonuclease McrA